MRGTLTCFAVITALGASTLGCAPYAYGRSSSWGASNWYYGRGNQQNAADEDADTEEGPPITTADRIRAQSVQVVQSLDGRHAEVVGAIDVHEEPGNQGNGMPDLRARAAQLGADAITSVEVHPPAPGENVTHFSALAIRFNDLLRGRPYQVIGEIDVDASMLHEDEAYAELRRRARELHADLLLDVRFDHGDGTGPLHMQAEAIRFVQQ